jgi:hypothetical protein
MRPRRLLKRILVAPHNVRFRDLLHILTHPGIPELLNLQEVKGEVKPYQVRQLLSLIERYDLHLGEDE